MEIDSKLCILKGGRTVGKYESFTLKELAFELDFVIGATERIVSDLVDVQIEFEQLVDSMNRAMYKGEERHYYHEHFRKIRVISNLLRYVTNDLSKESEVADKLRDVICKKVIKVKEEGETIPKFDNRGEQHESNAGTC